MKALQIGFARARQASERTLVALCRALVVAGILAVLSATVTAEARTIGLGWAAWPAADPPACTGDGVYLYDDINYGGRCGKFTASAPSLIDGNFNDLVSSLKLAGSYGGGRYRVTLCENTGYAGACSSYLADDAWVGDDAIGNDRASSLKVEINTNCTGDGVYLYDDINYGGRCWKWTADDPLFDEEYFHDVASSIRFVGSYGGGKYTATLYRDLNYGGASTTFGADDPWLGDDAVGSDQADAIRINGVPACTGDGVYLYEGANYTGRCRKFTASEPYLDKVAFADIASSVRLAGSYAGGNTKVTLCKDARYGGACSTFAGDDPELWDDVVGTDQASSLLLEPLCSAVTEIPPVECRALVALYNSTDGAHWWKASNWLVTTMPCALPWYGVGCANGHVIGLRFGENGLTGTIPPQLGSLANLQNLSLENNQLSGGIPPELANLTKLQYFNLALNRLGGSIPPELGNLVDLQSFFLSQNRFDGPIPASLGSLTNLTDLRLSGNELDGNIPPELGNLTNLDVLELDFNQLSGPIPSQFGKLTKLSLLDLSNNQLTGPVPPEFGSLHNLYELVLNHTLLSGPLPTTLTQLTGLWEFYFDHTQLCEPPDPAFQAWLTGISSLQRTGVLCPAGTATPTPTATRTGTPTATATRTPTATRTGGAPPSATPTLTPTSRPPLCSNLLVNGDFEAGVLDPWMAAGQAGLGAGRDGGHGAWLGGAVNTDAELFQWAAIPASGAFGKLAFWWRADAAAAQPADRLAVLLQYGEHADTLWIQAADGPPGQWRRQEVDLAAYRGVSGHLTFGAHNDAGVATTFRVDDVSLLVCRMRVYLPMIVRSPPASAPIFSDNFNDGDLAGWTPNGGAWQNTGAALRGERAGDVAYNMRSESGSDFTYEATITVHSGAAGLTFRSSADGSDSDCVAIDPTASRVKFCINGPWWYGSAKQMTLQYGRVYRLQVVARGTSFDVYLDGEKLLTTTSTRHAAGRFGVLAYEGAATFDDVMASTP